MKQVKYIIFLYQLFYYSFQCVAYNGLNVQPIKEILKNNPNISYQKCFDAFSFNYKSFPLSLDQNLHPAQGTFTESFVINISNAYIQSNYGFVTFDDTFIQEFIWKYMWIHLNLVEPINIDSTTKLPGKIAVISQLAFFNYFHWITEVLCRLALLELSNTSYDYLYVPQSSQFMKETLQLWGIDPSKIITPYSKNTFIQADQVIIPSLVSTIDFGCKLFSCYVQPHLLKYVKEKLLHAALQHRTSTSLTKKIFISRKDAPQRFIENEDEVFALFEQKGFTRYELSKLSVKDQILLFHNADIIIAPQGTTLANTIFCKPKTKVIELFQALNDATFWYLSQDLDLDYIPIQTTEFSLDYNKALSGNTIMPLSIIKNVIDNYLD